VAQQLMRGRRRWIVVAIAAVIVLALVLSALSGFYVDLLWFREVHFGGVFWTVYWSKVLLGTLAGALFFGLLVVNLVIARRLTPRFRPFSPEQELMERYRTVVDPYARFIIPIFAGFIAVFVGLAGSGQWQVFLLWRHAAAGHFPASLADPLFHRDPGFYIFSLPFLKWVQGWLFTALVSITVIVAIAHYLSGGIRVQAPGEKVTPQVKAHLSVLLGLIFLVKAWGYWLGKFDLLVSPRGVVTGASYTDIHAQLPALRLLVFIAIACGLLFLVNIRVRGWALPIIGIGLLALTSIVAGAIVPAIVQKLRVAPQEFQKEEPYIARNISATRFAFGLSAVRLTQQGQVSDDVTAQQVQQNSPTVGNIRLWSPEILRQTFDNLQRIQPYYEFSDVDVDRYTIDGQRRVVMLSAREVRQAQIPGGGGTWQNQHLFYTHGYGAVANPVNTVTSEGLPVFVLQNIPPTGRSGIPLSPEKGSQVYYGESHDVPYVITDSKMKELNFPEPSGNGLETTSYRGAGGIRLGGFFRRLVFAYRYHDFNLLISGLIDADSRVLINRDIRTRITKAAPFLLYDKDAYAAIVGGRLKYILDGYTTTDAYPYSQRANLSIATNGDLSGATNYIRNSVKAVVDAYDGTVTFYVVDPADPMIRVWESVFPHLFTKVPHPMTPTYQALQQHFRYPEDLMLVQAAQFANYHVTDPQTFYGKERFWALPPDPTSGSSTNVLRPYYVLLRPPGDSAERFVLFEPFTPFNRPNMVGYLIGQSDPGLYPGLEAVAFPTGENVDGPAQVFSRINQDPTFSQQRTLLGSGGSTVAFGNLLIVPIENSFLYVLPVYVVSAQASAIPELKRVLVVHGGKVAVGNSLTAALAASFGQVPPSPSGPSTTVPPGTGKVAQLLSQALQHFQTAQQDLRNGDLAGYQREIQLAQQLVQQAEQSANKAATATPSPSPSPSG
jgi:uncharacterized membrane protein (UPF0182 family)